jgi:hypothetical protein
VSVGLDSDGRRRYAVTIPGWDTFAVIIGGAAGALVGMRSVSVSIRIEVISGSPDFGNRGAATLSPFITVLLVAVLLAIPDQRRWEFGAELLMLAAALGIGVVWLDRRASARLSAQPISGVLTVVSPRTITTGAACADRVAAGRRGRRWRLCRGPVRERGDDKRRGDRLGCS